jgi:L-asparagine permease
MANNGHAPHWLTKMSKSHVPYAAILAIGGVYLVGILLNIWLGGSHAFDLALNSASIGVIFTWGAIFASQIALRKTKGKVSSLPAPGGVWTSWAGLISLLVITVLIGFDTMTSKTGEVFQLGLWTLATIPFFALLLWLGWQKVKNNEPTNALFN